MPHRRLPFNTVRFKIWMRGAFIMGMAFMTKVETLYGVTTTIMETEERLNLVPELGLLLDWPAPVGQRSTAMFFLIMAAGVIGVSCRIRT
jgi:hypothetical protein